MHPLVFQESNSRWRVSKYCCNGRYTLDTRRSCRTNPQPDQLNSLRERRLFNFSQWISAGCLLTRLGHILTLTSSVNRSHFWFIIEFASIKKTLLRDDLREDLIRLDYIYLINNFQQSKTWLFEFTSSTSNKQNCPSVGNTEI